MIPKLPDGLNLRYRGDPDFKLIVDMLCGLLGGGKFTPSELRDALIFASTLIEMQSLRSRTIDWDSYYNNPTRD